MTGEIVPDEAGAGSIDVGFAQFERNLIGDGSPVIVSMLFPAISDLPGLLVVVAGDGGIRPIMAIAGHLAAVVEVVEHAKFECEFVLVGSDVGTIHGERSIAIADLG